MENVTISKDKNFILMQIDGKTKPYTFHSAAYWGRANAWYLLALVDVLEAMNQAGQSSTKNYNTLKKHLADLAAGIAARQDNTTGGVVSIARQGCHLHR